MCDHVQLFLFFFFNDTATTEIYTLSLHDALPIYRDVAGRGRGPLQPQVRAAELGARDRHRRGGRLSAQQQAEEDEDRSEEHTSELQSRQYLVCRLLLEKKKK